MIKFRIVVKVMHWIPFETSQFIIRMHLRIVWYCSMTENSTPLLSSCLQRRLNDIFGQFPRARNGSTPMFPSLRPANFISKSAACLLLLHWNLEKDISGDWATLPFPQSCPSQSSRISSRRKPLRGNAVTCLFLGQLFSLYLFASLSLPHWLSRNGVCRLRKVFCSFGVAPARETLAEERQLRWKTGNSSGLMHPEAK